MRNNLALTLVPLLATAAHYTDKLSSADKAGVAVSVMNYFNTYCAVLFSGNLSEELEIHQISKKLHTEGLLTISVSMQNHQWKKDLSEHILEGRPLLSIIDSHNINVTLFLNELTGSLLYYRWLIFSEDSPEHLLRTVHVPISVDMVVCSNQWELSEVYHVARGMTLKVIPLGQWIEGVPLGARRSRGNLEGVALQGVTVHYPPLTVVSTVENVTSVSGFFGEFWHELEEELNFTTTFVFETEWGSKSGAGKWTGMLGRLFRREVDVAVTEFTMTSHRAEVVDFTLPLIYSSYCVFIRMPAGRSHAWTKFLYPFSKPLWYAVLLTILLISTMLVIIHHLGTHHAHWPQEDLMCSSVRDSLFYLLGIFCNQGVGVAPQPLVCRLVYLSACFCSVVVYAAYSAALVSSLTAQSSYLPFTTLEGIVEDGSYNMGVLEDSAEIQFFMDSKNPLMKTIYELHMAPDPRNFPSSVIQGLKRVCDTKYAFFAPSDDVYAYLNDIPCKIVRLPNVSITVSFAMALTKGHPFRGLINNRIQRLRVDGVLKRLRERAWPHKFSEEVNDWISVDFLGILPILVLLLFSACVAYALMCLELKFHKRALRANPKFSEEISNCSRKMQVPATCEEWEAIEKGFGMR